MEGAGDGAVAGVSKSSGRIDTAHLQRAHDSGIGLHLTRGEIKAVKIMEALAPGMDLPGNVCDSVRCLAVNVEMNAEWL